VTLLVQLRLEDIGPLPQVNDLSAMLDTVGGACVRLSDIALSLVGRGSPVSLPAGHVLERASVMLLEPIQVLENVAWRCCSILKRFPDGSGRARSAMSVVVVRGHRCLIERAAYVPSADLPPIYTYATGRARACVRDDHATIPDTAIVTTRLP